MMSLSFSIEDEPGQHRAAILRQGKERTLKGIVIYMIDGRHDGQLLGGREAAQRCRVLGGEGRGLD